jgi:hypothetical protein
MSTTEATDAFPAYWDWKADGLTVEGTFVRMDQRPTAYGPKPILILDVDGVERSVWVNTNALRSKLAGELQRRKARNFDVGERVVIRRGAEKTTSANDRNYWPFQVKFPDGPELDAASILDVDDDDEPVEQDGIPF